MVDLTKIWVALAALLLKTFWSATVYQKKQLLVKGKVYKQSMRYSNAS
jgi:hypothetical protein